MLKILILWLFSFLLLAGFMSPVLVAAQDGTASADLQDITENVKRRLQNIARVRGSTISAPPTKVYVGILKDRSNNILTIMNGTQTLLASTSASTRSVRLPGTTKIDLEDLVLEENIVSIGLINADRVMVTDQIIVQVKPPVESDYKTIIGTLITYDPKKFVVVIQPPQSQQPVSIDIVRNTRLFTLETDSTKTPFVRTNTILSPARMLVVYAPPEAGEDIVATEVLVSPL